jgi:uncharacterized protein (TIGR02453 family)
MRGRGGKNSVQYLVMKKAYFDRELFQFLRELKVNNNREWFQANKQRYEKKVKQPLLQFIADFAPNLRKIHPRFVADPRPTGGSMFRIYRDIRFSEDKSPYKTMASAHFPHHKAGKEVHVPDFICISNQTNASRQQASGIPIHHR